MATVDTLTRASRAAALYGTRQIDTRVAMWIGRASSEEARIARFLSVKYLLNPGVLRTQLEKYPSLQRSLDLLRALRGRSAFFREAIVEDRGIYRLLASGARYPHIDTLLDELEYCLANGFDNPTLIRTRAQRHVSSAVAEVLVAAFFLRQGLTVKSLDNTRDNRSVPDLLMSSPSIRICGEVYQPRDLDGLELFGDDLSISLLHMDVPWDFEADIDISEHHRFHEGELAFFDHRALSRRYADDCLRAKSIDVICGSLSLSLFSGVKGPVKTLSDRSANAKVTVRLRRVRRPLGIVPRRAVRTSGPNTAGDAPEWLFKHLVTRGISQKLRKGQAAALQQDGVRTLFVDISRLSYSSEFDHCYYAPRFCETLDAHVDLLKTDYDAIAFFEKPIRERMRFPLVRCRDEETRARLMAVIGERR